MRNTPNQEVQRADVTAFIQGLGPEKVAGNHKKTKPAQTILNYNRIRKMEPATALCLHAGNIWLRDQNIRLVLKSRGGRLSSHLDWP